MPDQKTQTVANFMPYMIDSDYELILPLLSGSSRQTREALKALVKLDSSRVQQELLRALADHRSAMRHH